MHKTNTVTPKPRNCHFCVNNVPEIDYKDTQTPLRLRGTIFEYEEMNRRSVWVSL